MIINKNSRFRFPPRNLEPKLVMIFNAITYSVDICDITYKRLYNELLEFSNNPKSTNENFPKIFADTWTIISNATIFMNLILNHFEIENDDKALDELKKAKKLRNSYQHIDERITEVLTDCDLPIYGSLSWFRNIPKTNKYEQFLLYSGAFTKNKEGLSGQIVLPKQKIGNDEIEEIIFENIIKKGKNFPSLTISIKKLILDIEMWMNHFENQINEQLKDFDKIDTHKSNLFCKISGHFE